MASGLELPLVVAAAAFGAFMVWKHRPVGLLGRSHEGRDERDEAAASRAEAMLGARLSDAATPAAKALVLCDAADAAAGQLGKAALVRALYLRALRTDPRSAEIVQRASRTLARRPRTLAALLWRTLAAHPWTPPADSGRVNAVATALAVLTGLYDGPLGDPVLARATAHARAALFAEGAATEGEVLSRGGERRPE
jgi:hypothetical protein